MPSLIQPSFSAGEITPSAFGRIDLSRYGSGLKTLRNNILRVHGGTINRPGTGFIAPVKDPTVNPRLIPFKARTNDTYVLSFGHLTMHVLRNGGLVLEANKTITATTNTSQVRIDATAHGFANGDWVFVTGTGIAALDNRYWIINAVTTDAFQLVGSTAPGSTSAVGTVARVFELATPYTEDQLDDIKYTQLNDVMTFTHNDVQTRDLSRIDHASWTLENMEFEQGPFQDINVTKFSETAKGVVASAATGVITLESSHEIFLPEHIGMLFYLEQKDRGIPWEVTKVIVLGDIRQSNGKYYEALNAGTTGTERPVHEVDTAKDGSAANAVTWLYKHNGYGVARIDSIIAPNLANATVLSEMPLDVVKANQTITGAANNAGLVRITLAAHGYTDNDFIMVRDVMGTIEANGLWRITNATGLGTFDLVGSVFANAYVGPSGQATVNGSYKWAFGAWGGDRGWPGAVTYFQQRKTLASTPPEPLKTWHSGTNHFPFFGKSAPIVDDDSFSMTLASNVADPIVHLISMGKLIALTSSIASRVKPSMVGGGKWIIPDDDNSPILTPSKRSARSQEGESVLYWGANSQTCKDLAYDFASNSFAGTDLSVLSKHLCEGHQIVDAAYQHVPFQVYWSVRDDGVLIGMTYLKEHQVWGWHRHDTKHGFFERVCVIPEGNEDAVYFVVRREINGQTVRYYERLASRLYADQRDCFFVDCGLTYDGRNTTLMTMTLSGGLNVGYGFGDYGELPYGETSDLWFYKQDLTLIAGGYGTGDYGDEPFHADDVGSEIHFTAADGRILKLAIKTFINFSTVIVRANRNVPLELQDTAIVAWEHARSRFLNLGHLEGETVSILADAHVYPEQVVINETVNLQYCAAVVHIGLGIEADFETLNLNVASAGGLLEKEKLLFNVRLLVEASRGIWAGSDADNLMEYAQRRDENYDRPVEPFTGLVSISVPARYEPGGRVFVRQSDPLPISILAAMPDVDMAGAK